MCGESIQRSEERKMKTTRDYSRAVQNIRAASSLGVWPTLELRPDENPVCPWCHVLVTYHGPGRLVRQIPTLYDGEVRFDAIFAESIDQGVEILRELRSLLG